MPRYEITNGGEVLGLEFGQIRSALRERLGAHIEFERPVGRTVDFYVDLGLQLSFDDDDRLGYVCMLDPARVSLAGVELLDRPLGTVQAQLARAGYAVDLDEDGLSVTRPAIALWSSAADEPEEPIESVAVGDPGLA